MYRNVALHALQASDIAVVCIGIANKKDFLFSVNSLALFTTTPGVVPLEGQKGRRHVLIRHEKSEFAVIFFF
jgi:hypothetical protein